MKKLEKLKKIISGKGSVLVAFSGGTDSSFLLKVASMVLPPKCLLAVTAVSPTYPREELESARRTARSFGVRHKIIKTNEHKDRNFTRNPANRCYFCKRELFASLNKLALRFQLNYVVDAANLSDKGDFRPGEKAKKELGIRSPLVEAGLTKAEVRGLSKKLKLPTWNKPNLACLASRIPYGDPLTTQALKRVEQGESFLKSLGLTQVRLRHYNGSCRIEVLPKEIPRLVRHREAIVAGLKKLGYDYVALDLEGYRIGSMNMAIGKTM